MYHIVRNSAEGAELIKQNQLGDLEYLTFPALCDTGMVGHLFTTRTGGVSTGDLASMNLSFSRGDNPANVVENYRRICEVLGVEAEDVVASVQTHTTNIRHVTAADKGKGVLYPQDYQDIDGLITDEPGVVLACFYADCVPLYFVDPVKQAIGLAHSGWRGTVNGMGAHMVQAMKEAFGSKPRDLIAAVGPSICRDCYEVSEDVAMEFQGVFPGEEVVCPGREPAKYQLDLWLANRLILERAGIHRENISVTDICTCHNPEYLFSHRASHGKRGNLAAFLYILNKFSKKA
ncbi:MAG: peptidoglycan editing factor PgeF [Lachnospiraceae bacterium]|nr:peptidoglycan editing factor PgeF [Lachnospiraceae bacterium]